MKAVSGKEMCRILEKHGWTLKRVTKGSHHIYVKPGAPATLSIPVHGARDLKRGLQMEIMKQAGLTEDDL